MIGWLMNGEMVKIGKEAVGTNLSTNHGNAPSEWPVSRQKSHQALTNEIGERCRYTSLLGLILQAIDLRLPNMNMGTKKNEKSLRAHSETEYTPHWIYTCLLPYIA
jgi:hypothetical protein